MSYVFSGKIQSAMFVNPPQNTVIELLYGEGSELTAFHLDVDYSNDEFLGFIDEWPLEKIEKTSRDNARTAMLAQLGVPHLNTDIIWNYILKNNNDKNIVFDMKLALLDSYNVSISLEGKRKLRNSKTLTELFGLYNEYCI